MSNPNLSKIKDYVTQNFSRELSLLLPGQPLEKLIARIPEEQLTDLATGDISVVQLTGFFEDPSIKSVYWQIAQNYPNMKKMYPDVDIFELPQNQLERLARGDHLKEVLGKPTNELDVLSRQDPNSMEPPKRKTPNYLRPASPKTASFGGGNRTGAANSYNNTYRGRSGGN